MIMHAPTGRAGRGLPPAAGSVLVVDDEPQIVDLVRQVLTGDGFRVTSAGDGQTALARVAADRPDLVVLDLDMPRLGGLEVCRQLRADPATRLLPVLVVTGRPPADSRRQAWDLGADDYLTKPFRPLDIRSRCRALVRHKWLVDQLESAESVVFALARAVEAKSPYTHGHSERVAGYARFLAGRLGLSAAEADMLHRGALLHDIGKIGIPDAILDKPAALTTAERATVQDHPAAGARILEPLRSMQDAVPLVRWHHERWDGGGYPDGLAGEAIPLPARVLAVADVYDALASDRPYRVGMPHRRCLEVLAADAAGGGLDPRLVQVFAAAAADHPPDLSRSGPGN